MVCRRIGCIAGLKMNSTSIHSCLPSSDVVTSDSSGLYLQEKANERKSTLRLGINAGRVVDEYSGDEHGGYCLNIVRMFLFVGQVA